VHSMLVAIDTAKAVFQLAVSSAAGQVQIHRRVSRQGLVEFLGGLAPCVVIMEACGSSHYWARRFHAMGHRVALLPPHLVKPYVSRNKTDRADAKALLEAYRNEEIKPVPAKTAEQQVLTTLHALRSSCMKQRVMGLNELRGHLREHGFFIPLGAKRVVPAAWLVIQDAEAELPDGLRAPLAQLCQHIEALDERIAELERQLKVAAATIPLVARLMEIPGIGLLIATALVAYVGDLHRFPTARHFASYLGLTPRERSSGSKRRLGRISKMGNPYLRTLLVHGARAALTAGRRAQTPDLLRRWALDIQSRRHHNKATVALANKLARIAWAVGTRATAYGNQPPRAAAA
jgi:transposase